MNNKIATLESELQEARTRTAALEARVSRLQEEHATHLGSVVRVQAMMLMLDRNIEQLKQAAVSASVSVKDWSGYTYQRGRILATTLGVLCGFILQLVDTDWTLKDIASGNATVITATSMRWRMRRVGDNMYEDYDIGAGWVNLRTQAGQTGIVQNGWTVSCERYYAVTVSDFTGGNQGTAGLW